MTEYSWDAEKAAANERKHRIDFQTAALVFLDPERIEYRDDQHSEKEERWIAIGRARTMILFVVYVERDEDTVRIISARKATKDEQKDYREIHS